MRIVTPRDIEEVAWEGYLEPSGEVYRKGVTLPRVTLGEPAWWPAEEALQAETGTAWQPPAGDRRYALLRLACTLHPPREAGDHYTAATLSAYLRPAGGAAGAVVAHDLYPRRLTAERIGTFSVTLGPDLQFGSAVKFGLGEVGAEIEYRQAFPVIQGYGLGESAPYWQFARHAAHPLLGCQSVLAVLAAPGDAGGVRLSVELVVTLETRYGPFRLGLPEEARAHLGRTHPFAPAGRPTAGPGGPQVAAIRGLLHAAFAEESLRRFCADRPAFRPLAARFSQADGLAALVDKVLTYCGERLLWDELLAGVQEANPGQYARFAGGADETRF